MRKIIKKAVPFLVFLLIAGVLLGSVALFSDKGKVEQQVAFQTGKIAPLNKIPDDETLLLEDGGRSLYLGKQGDCATLRVVDKVTNKEWKSYRTQQYYGKELKGNAQLATISSMLTLYYTDYDKSSGSVMAGGRGTSTSYKMNGNKAEFLFDFSEQNIQVTVEVYLENGALNARIPFNGIRENGKYGLVSLELFPCFEASRVEEDGYIFVPDGCGALYDFKGRLQGTTLRYWDVYSPSDTDIDLIAENKNEGIYSASLPVYGIKTGDQAFYGVITDGDSDAQIVFAPAGYRIDMYRVYSSFTYRKRYTYQTATKDEIVAVDKSLIQNDFAVRYDFLEGENADYSGMAVGYRNYLINSGGLRQAVTPNDQIAFSVDFLMGIEEQQMLIDSQIGMTNFEEAHNILGILHDNGMENVQTMLYGWQEGGYGENPTSAKAGGGIGGFAGLKSLAEQVNSFNYRLFAVGDYCQAAEGINGFSSRKQAIHDMNRLILSDDENKNYLINPRDAKGFYQLGLHSLSDKAPISGMALDSVGSLIYADRYLDKTIDRAETVKIWQEMLRMSNEEFGCSAAEGANAYTYGDAYRLYNVPSDSSNFFKFGHSVPFVQMVLHGSVYYSTELGNQSYDIQQTKLKWIEQGAMPAFLLTAKSAVYLKNTELNLLFASDADRWTEYIIELYKELNDGLRELQAAKMMEHTYISNDLVRVDYDNGKRVYVNYGETEQIIDGQTITARNYLIV